MKKTVAQGEVFDIPKTENIPPCRGVYVTIDNETMLAVFTTSEANKMFSRNKNDRDDLPKVKRQRISMEDTPIFFATLLVGFTLGIIVVIIFAHGMIDYINKKP